MHSMDDRILEESGRDGWIASAVAAGIVIGAVVSPTLGDGRIASVLAAIEAMVSPSIKDGRIASTVAEGTLMEELLEVVSDGDAVENNLENYYGVDLH